MALPHDGQNNKPTLENGLTPKQRLFVDFYLESLNASQSYLKAFSTKSRRTAEVNSSKLLKSPIIQGILRDRMEELESERIASATEVVEFLTKTMRDDKEKTSERLKAGELIGKRYAMFTDKTETSGAMDVVINLIDDVEPEEDTE